MDDEVKTSGIFHTALINQSGIHIKITRNASVGLLKSCAEDKVCTIHRIVTFHKPKRNPNLKLLRRVCMQYL